MIPDYDLPYALGHIAEIERRLAMLSRPHIAPLVEYAQQITMKMGNDYEIPYFDPCDGGIFAETLFLMEAPGKKAVGSHFISRNNPDPSAKTMCTLLAEAELQRKATLIWNIVPWYIGNKSTIRPANKTDIEAALPFLKGLINFLPNLKAIMLVGRKAQSAKLQICQLTDARLFETHHPSQRVMNRWPERRVEMLETFKSLTSFLKNGA